jgi:hypothetical protein
MEDRTMIFCENCGSQTQLRDKTFRVVVQKRDKTYYGLDKYDNQKEIARGWEIVKEINCCKKCKEEITNEV